jgi:hypothetical protein
MLSIEQGLAERVLEIADMVTDRGRGQTEIGRCGFEAAKRRRRLERAQGGDGHAPAFTTKFQVNWIHVWSGYYSFVSVRASAHADRHSKGASA